MISFLIRYKKDIIALFILITVSFLIRVIALDRLPENITGDETTNLLDIYQLFYGKTHQLFGFVGDGTEAGFTTYWYGVFFILFGTDNHGFIALRLAVATLSILSLIAFYFLLKEKTSRTISLIGTLMLSANYIFLNFSRTGWLNMWVICFGLFFILFLGLMLTYKKFIYMLLTSISAALLFCGYHFGKILLLFVCIYLLILYCNVRTKDKMLAQKIFLFFLITIGLLTPFLTTIALTGGKSLFLRPQTVFVFNPLFIQTPYVLLSLIFTQALQNVRGLLFLDGSAVPLTLENARYGPFTSPPVDFIIKILFFPSLFFGIIYHRTKLTLWWIIAGATFLTEFLTIDTPNFARGLFMIPFIYFLIGIFFYQLQQRLSSYKIQSVFKISLAIVAVIIFFFDLAIYVSWIQLPSTVKNRSPYLTIHNFRMWQKDQVNRIKENKAPLTLSGTDHNWYPTDREN